MAYVMRNNTYVERSNRAQSKINMILEVAGVETVLANSSFINPKTVTVRLQFMEISPEQAEEAAARFEQIADDIRDALKTLRPTTAEVMG